MTKLIAKNELFESTFPSHEGEETVKTSLLVHSNFGVYQAGEYFESGFSDISDLVADLRGQNDEAELTHELDGLVHDQPRWVVKVTNADEVRYWGVI